MVEVKRRPASGRKLWRLLALSLWGETVGAPAKTGAQLPTYRRWGPPLREGSAEYSGVFAVAACTATAATMGQCTRRKSRSPLREGPAIRTTIECDSSDDEAARNSAIYWQAGSNADKGVDVLGVKRANAPKHTSRMTGNFDRAKQALNTRSNAESALRKLRKDVYSKSSIGPRQRKLKALKVLARTAQPPFELIPLTMSSIELLAAALKEGKYRTGGAYLQIAKKTHLMDGHTWGEALQTALRDAQRSITRGIGPPAHAADFQLENLVSCGSRKVKAVTGAPICATDVGTCMALWMLRGIEAASLLGEQVMVDAKLTTAVLDLGPTKEDVEGRGCRRTLVCACGEGGSSGVPVLCPVHAMDRILRKRAEMGLTGKHPLFPTKKGGASSAKGVCRTFSALLRVRVTEHSFRRAGAQYYARRGVVIGIIQFLGRWGSETVYRYVGEALDSIARGAAKTAAGVLGPSCTPELSSRLEPAKIILNELGEGGSVADHAEEIVRRAVEAAQVAISKSCLALEFKLSAAAEIELGAVKPVGRAAARSHTHRIALGDARFPTELWTTACGWRFGSVDHVRVNVSEITCGSCRKIGSCGAIHEI